MAYSISRLTMFALISSIEEDLRRIIVENIERIPKEILNEETFNKCYKRFSKEKTAPQDSIPLDDIVDYLDFQESYDTLLSNRDQIPEHIYHLLKANEGNILKIVPIRNRVAHSRPLEVDDYPNLVDSVESILVSTSNELFINTSTTLLRLKEDPSYVLNLTIPNYYFLEEEVYHNLPLPDFDDTGFIGRKEPVSNVIKACLGPWPVISIVGDGGLGKTALALKIAYDILSLDQRPFDAIIWTSSKTSQLTGSEIKKIDGAIEDSMGMFKSVSKELGEVNDSEDFIESVLEYMGMFKILLIIDNLETILDEKIKGFLGNLPLGSKILITSRIGLGDFERRIKLDPLSSKEAIQLLRSISTIQNIKSLTAMHNNKLEIYCNKMNNNPGFIKWFVNAVVTGKRPEEVLANPAIFLDFCMSNVYNFLDLKSKEVLSSMMCISKELSQAELGYINDIDSITLQKSLQRLLTTNMVTMHSIPFGSTYVTKYGISEFARSYLSMHHPVRSEEFKRYKQKQNRMTAEAESAMTEEDKNQYSFNYISARSKSDSIIVRYLSEALGNAKIKDFEKALRIVTEAHNLAPEYYEVKRIEGLIRSLQGMTSEANECYQAAVELNPGKPHVHYWYGHFLLKYLDETEEALLQFEKVVSLDPDSIVPQIEVARVNMYLGKYDDSISMLERIKNEEKCNRRENTFIYDLIIQNYYRKAETYLDKDDIIEAISLYEKAFESYYDCPDYSRDPAMSKTFRKVEYSLQRCAKILSSDKQPQSILDRVIRLMERRESIVNSNKNERELNKETGKVFRLVREKGYGFILDESSGSTLFFHISSFLKESEFYKLKIDDSVRYIKITNNKNKEEAVSIEKK